MWWGYIVDDVYHHLYTFILVLSTLFTVRIECDVHDKTWSLKRKSSGLKHFKITPHRQVGRHMWGARWPSSDVVAVRGLTLGFLGKSNISQWWPAKSGARRTGFTSVMCL